MGQADDVSSDPWWRSATELLADYRAGVRSPVEVVTRTIDRIESLNSHLAAFLSVDRDAALRAAQEAEQRYRSGVDVPSLCGVPVSLKDSIEYAGLPTTYGSLAFVDNWREDSAVADRLRRSGAVVLGKTNMPEFAQGWTVRNRLGDDGRNPWDVTRTCGGSSGGAAAAVAAGLGPVAVGTDSSGSIRVPAAYNGVFGFKPTYQRIPSVQVWRASPLRSHIGLLSRTVADCRLLFAALAGFDRRDPASALPPVEDADDGFLHAARVGVLRAAGDVVVDEVVANRLDLAAELLEDLGCRVVEAVEPFPLRADRPELASGVWAYSGDHYAAAEHVRAGFWESHAGDLTDYAHRALDAGRTALAWQYRRVLDADRAFGLAVRDWLAPFDFVLAPVAGPAPPLEGDTDPEDQRRRFSFNSPFNLAHVPAASVPFDVTAQGLPIAVQIIGQHGDDARVLALCSAMEQHRPWRQRRPHLEVPAVGAEGGLPTPRLIL